ncbi:hypothetical protein T01_3957 [Trichinella spiralis]|uniref:Uncharacterized protein n=1 Tax=Trichinella spiralis TaxID=6334 RepID=A0A0V1A3T5_TRISP|nr:hypothetical protein T01_3957 [Trichinella spiralis]
MGEMEEMRSAGVRRDTLYDGALIIIKWKTLTKDKKGASTSYKA